MTLLFFIVALALPTLLGWLLLLSIEGRSPVLGTIERICWSLTLGPTLFALAAFVSHALGWTDLTLGGFLIPAGILGLLLVCASFRRGAWRPASTRVSYAPSKADTPRFVRIGVGILVLWTVLKLLAGSYDLLSVPTYWDDSFNNWNMRGKMFFQSEKLLLEIPVGNGIVQASGGVSSYPPMLPMLKSWTAVLSGSWHEPSVNGVHLLWIVSLSGIFYFALRRTLGQFGSLFGVSLLWSLPFLLVQATNPYADVLLACHVLIATLCVYRLAEAKSLEESRSWSHLSGMAIGLLLFTKNEATMLYAPLLTIGLLWTIFRNRSMRDGFFFALRSIIWMLVLALPWLSFKWIHGLSFGNAKDVSSLAIAFHPEVIEALWFHLTHEANWLLLPLLLPLALIASGRRALALPRGMLTLIVLGSFIGQCFLYLFTPLATEAIMQTGISRGLLHIAPIALLIVILIAKDTLQDSR